MTLETIKAGFAQPHPTMKSSHFLPPLFSGRSLVLATVILAALFSPACQTKDIKASTTTAVSVVSSAPSIPSLGSCSITASLTYVNAGGTTTPPPTTVTFTAAGAGTVTPASASSDNLGQAVTTLTGNNVTVDSDATVTAAAASGGSKSVTVTVRPPVLTGTYSTTNSTTGISPVPVGTWRITPSVTKETVAPHKGELKYEYTIEAGSLDIRAISIKFSKPTNGAITVTNCTFHSEHASDGDKQWDILNDNVDNPNNTTVGGWDHLTVTAYFEPPGGGTATFNLTSVAVKHGILTPTGPM